MASVVQTRKRKVMRGRTRYRCTQGRNTGCPGRLPQQALHRLQGQTSHTLNKQVIRHPSFFLWVKRVEHGSSELRQRTGGPLKRGRASRGEIGSLLTFNGVVVQCSEPVQVNQNGLVFGFAVVGDELVNIIEIGKDAATGFAVGDLRGALWVEVPSARPDP